MNIAVFGWYHHQNAGDDRIEQCLTRWLDGHTLMFLPAGRPPPLELLRTCDAAIIGGGGIAWKRGGVFRDMRRWVRSAGIPVAIAGISIEGDDPAMLRELRAFLDVASFAWFRDRGSLDKVGPHPRAFIAPDITWLDPFPPTTDDGDGVAVGLRQGGDLPVEKWRAALERLDLPCRAWPLYFEQGGDAALAETLLPGHDVPHAFGLEPARRAAAIVTGRFHGLLFGLQLGRPVLTVSSRPKVRRFLDEHGLADWRVDEGAPEAFTERWSDFVAAWPTLRQRAHEIRADLVRAVADLATPARDRLLATAAALPPPSRRPVARLRRLLDLGRWL